MRTNMREAIPQMARIGDIGDALDTIKTRLDGLDRQSTLDNNKPDDQSRAGTRTPYDIGQSDRSEDAINIHLWVYDNHPDQAVKV
jgi:hypothetical protein